MMDTRDTQAEIEMREKEREEKERKEREGGDERARGGNAERERREGFNLCGVGAVLVPV